MWGHIVAVQRRSSKMFAHPPSISHCALKTRRGKKTKKRGTGTEGGGREKTTKPMGNVGPLEIYGEMSNAALLWAYCIPCIFDIMYPSMKIEGRYLYTEIVDTGTSLKHKAKRRQSGERRLQCGGMDKMQSIYHVKETDRRNSKGR